jgi:hypothetical protein
MNLTLGILYKDNKIVNHRSLLKVLINPILRYFGFQIGTPSNLIKLTGLIKFMKCEKTNNIKWNFNSYNEYDRIVKKRRII